MVMSEGAAYPPHHNGHQGIAPTRLTISGAEERPAAVLGPSGDGAIPGRDAGLEPGRPQRLLSAPPFAGPAEPEPDPSPLSSLTMQAGDAGDHLSQIRAHAASLAAQAQTEAEEILSRANAQAELLRMHAEAMRAEAESLRAEAAGLRAAARQEAEAASLSAESAANGAQTAAEALRTAMQREVEAARAEFEQMRADAARSRRALRAEIDAGLADAERMRDEVQRLCAETNKLAAELRLLFAAGATDQGEAESDPAGTLRNGSVADESARTAADPASPPDQAGDPPAEKQLAELLRMIWEAASAGQSPLLEPLPNGGGPGADAGGRPLDPGAWGSREPVGEKPVGRPSGTARPPEPLIGSGGWRARQVAAPDDIPGTADAPPPPPTARRRWRRLGQ